MKTMRLALALALIVMGLQPSAAAYPVEWSAAGTVLGGRIYDEGDNSTILEFPADTSFTASFVFESTTPAEDLLSGPDVVGGLYRNFVTSAQYSFFDRDLLFGPPSTGAGHANVYQTWTGSGGPSHVTFFVPIATQQYPGLVFAFLAISWDYSIPLLDSSLPLVPPPSARAGITSSYPGAISLGLDSLVLVPEPASLSEAALAIAALLAARRAASRA
jgi:hypothetical protein